MDLKEKVEILKKKNKIKQIKGLDALIELADLIRSERGDLKRLIEKVGGTLKNLESLDFNDLIATIKQIKISPQVNVNVEYLQGVEKLLKELKQQQQADDSFDAEKLIRLLKKPENAIAVRLTKKDANEFYNALMTVIGGGGGGGGGGGISVVQHKEGAVHKSGDTGTMGLGVRQDTLAPLAADGKYTPFQTDAKGAIWVHEEPSLIDTGNSSTATLTGGSVFTGTGKDVLNYQAITIQLDASHNSATNGIKFQFSIDNSNWDDIYPFTYTAADGARRFQFPSTARYFRVVYTNGGTGQSHFRLQTILHHTTPLTSIHRLVDDTANDRSATIVKAAIIAQRAGGGPGAGDFVAIQATAAGNLKMSVQEISDGLDVGAGNAGSETQRVILATDQPAVPTIEAAPSTLVAFVTDIPTAGSRVQLATNTIIAGVLEAPSTNSGNVFIGGSNVSSTIFGSELQPGQSIGVAIDNTDKIWIDAASSGDDVAFFGS